MPTAENAKLQYEAGQSVTAMSALTDSGDHKTFTSSAAQWSKKSGYEPDVKPDGLATGGVISAGSGNDEVDVSALTCYLAGVKTTVSASAGETITRPATAVAKINSITINSSGTIAVVVGTDGSNTTFSETRGAAGGPPEIPAGSIEIGQVRVTSDTSAVISASEIFQVVGLHVERYDYPVWETETAEGQITFADALPTIHASGAVKGVNAEYAEPIFSDVQLASDFVPPETTHSVSSTQVYGSTIGSSSASLNQGTFTARIEDGISDALTKLKNENLWFKFFPDRYKSPYMLVQGKLGVSRSYPAGDSMQAACTISAESAGVEVEA
jgi:hypothetical protein